MDIPIINNLNRLGVAGYVLLGILGVIMAYLLLSNRVHIMYSMIVLSAALVGSSVTLIDSLSTVARWFTIFLLFVAAMMHSKMKVSLGGLFFWLYIFFGLFSLFRSLYFSWQFQRCILLLIVAVAISLAFGDKPVSVYKSALMYIGIAATIYSIAGISFLPNQLNDPTRFSGFAKTAPSFAMTLGGLLPFTLYGFLQSKSTFLKLLYGVGFLAGAITLVFTGQRTGTIAGLVSLLPMLFLVKQTKNFWWYVVLVIAVVAIGQVFLQKASLARLDFLTKRYSISYGLSDRDILWAYAWKEISKNPYFGKGIGAAESIIAVSFHQTYLEIWFNSGLFGLSFFIFAQIYYFFRAFIEIRRTKDPEMLAILCLALGYLVGFFSSGLTESIGAGASNLNLVLYIFIGVLVSNLDLFKAVVPSLGQSQV